MNHYAYLRQLPDPDGDEVAEWVDSVDHLARFGGPSRARRLLLPTLRRAGDIGIDLPAPRITDYVNTIPAADEPPYPGDEGLERPIRHLIRWNAAVMVARGQPPLRRPRRPSGHLRLGGDAVRGRLQPLLPRQSGGRARRPAVHPGPRVARDLRPGLSRGPSQRGGA